jgi:hypothetical protein
MKLFFGWYCLNSFFFLEEIVKNEAEWYGAAAAPVTQRLRSYLFPAETQSYTWTLIELEFNQPAPEISSQSYSGSLM